VRALVAVAVLAVLSPTAAAAQWSPPQTLSRAHFDVSGTIGFTSNGTASASWAWQDGVGEASTVGFSMATRRVSDAAFGPERDLPARDVVAGPAPFRRARTVVARLKDRPSGRDHLRIQLGDLGGRFRKPRTVARRRGISEVRLAVNARGRAALAWYEDRRPGGDRVYVSLRRAGGSFGRLRRLAQEPVRHVSVAVGPAGDVLVAWQARGTIRTRFKPRSRRGFGRTDTLRSHDAFSAALRTGIAPSGHAWIAWTAQQLTEGGPRGNAFVQAAVRSPGARRFGRALLLARRGPDATPSPVSLGLDARGAATLAWTMWEQGTTTVQAARVSASGAAARADVTRFPSLEPVDVASTVVDADGNAVVAWSQIVHPSLGTSHVYASPQPPGGAWGAPELVSSGLAATRPIAAYPPPGGGPPVVLFANRPTLQPMVTVVQLATRAG
jgi:hypothetical protein